MQTLHARDTDGDGNIPVGLDGSVKKLIGKAKQVAYTLGGHHHAVAGHSRQLNELGSQIARRRGAR